MTSSPTINNIVDLYRIIDEQPEWAEALRSRLLGAELLAMPRQLAQLTAETRDLRAITEKLAETAAEHTVQLVEHTRQLAELTTQVKEHTVQLAELTTQVKEHTVQLTELTTQVKEHTVQLTELTTQVKEHTVQLTELTTQVKEHTVQLTELTAQVKEHTVQLTEQSRQIAELTTQVKEHTVQLTEQSRQLTELRRIAENHTARMERIGDDTGNLKGMFAEIQAEKTIVAIAADFDLHDPVLVSQTELMKMALQLGLDPDTRKSFVRADIVFQARDEAGNALYAAVEVSWTADWRDTGRARRNAALLEQATGYPAWSIVAGNRWVNDLDWTGIRWFLLEA